MLKLIVSIAGVYWRSYDYKNIDKKSRWIVGTGISELFNSEDASGLR